MLVGEIRRRVPRADLVDARQTERFFVLIDGVLQFAHPQRAAGKAERGAVAIARLRIVVAIAAGRIAGEHRGKRCNLLARIDLYAHAGRCERIGRSATAHIGAEYAGPAERAVDQAAGGIAGEEFAVADDLTDPHQDLVGKALLEVGGIQTRRRQCIEIARIENAAAVFCDVAAAIVNLEYGDVRLAAGPADQFFQVGIDRKMHLAFVARFAPDAARHDRKNFVCVFELDLDAGFFLQRGARAAPIAGQRLLFPDGFGFVFRQRTRRGEHGACRHKKAQHDKPRFVTAPHHRRAPVVARKDRNCQRG